MAETKVASHLSLPGNDFVNPLFNSIVIIALGVVLVKNRLLACASCTVALFMYTYSTLYQSPSLPQSLNTERWKTSDDSYVGEFLMLSLVRWVSGAVFSAFTIRKSLKFTSQIPGDPVLTVRSMTLSVFLFVTVLLRGFGELFSIRILSDDWGVHFYCGVGHVLDALRVSLQGILVYQGLVVHTRTSAEKIDVAHIFVFSTLHLVRCVIYCIAGLQDGHVSVTSITIMTATLVGGFVQLCWMKKTIWAYVRLVDLIAAVFFIPGSILFPPYDEDFITPDMEEVIAPPPPPPPPPGPTYIIAGENSGTPPEMHQSTHSYITTDNPDTLQPGTNQPPNVYNALSTDDLREEMLDNAIQHRSEAATLDLQEGWYHLHKFPKHYPEDDNEAKHGLVHVPTDTWRHNSVEESGKIKSKHEELVM